MESRPIRGFLLTVPEDCLVEVVLLSAKHLIVALLAEVRPGNHPILELATVLVQLVLSRVKKGAADRVVSQILDHEAGHDVAVVDRVGMSTILASMDSPFGGLLPFDGIDKSVPYHQPEPRFDWT